MSKKVYISSIGAFLPNDPISNEGMEDYLGRIKGKDSSARKRILKQNGITSRHYALDVEQRSTHSNAELAAEAAKQAVDRSSLLLDDLELVSTGTTQSDLPVPGLASMVHAELGNSVCEIASFQSVCASGVMAIQECYAQIKAGLKSNALSVGSEFSSRLFKSSRFEAQGVDKLPFDTEFLRWMLSDGAGAMVIQDAPNDKGLSLEIEWIDIKSFAHENPLCMYVGGNEDKDKVKSW